MMIKLTLQNGKPIMIRQSAVLSVYIGYHKELLEDVTFVQVGHTTHAVQESLEDIIRYFEV